MPERFQIKREEEPKPKPSGSEARRLLLLRAGFGLAGFIILIVVIVVAVKLLGVAQRSARIYELLHTQSPTALSTQSEIRAFAASLTPGQVRVLSTGGALDYTRLPAEQKNLFNAIQPLTEIMHTAYTPALLAGRRRVSIARLA